MLAPRLRLRGGAENVNPRLLGCALPVYEALTRLSTEAPLTLNVTDEDTPPIIAVIVTDLAL